MKRRKDKKKERGITLIALIITIIVMLILVTVTVTSAINGGIFKKAWEAVSKTKDSMKNEQDGINELLAEMEKLGNWKDTPPAEAIPDEKEPVIDEIKIIAKTSNSIEIEVETTDTQEATYKYYLNDEENGEEIAENTHEYTDLQGGKEYTLKVEVTNKGGKSATDSIKGITMASTGTYTEVTTEYKDKEENTAIIPAGFTVSGVESEQSIDGGLVVYVIPKGTTVDWTNSTAVANAKKTYDQFVWIPIKQTTDNNAQDINDMYICQGKTETNGECKITVVEEDGVKKAHCETHNNDNMAGRLYASQAGGHFEEGKTEVYSTSYTLREPDVVTGRSETDYDANSTYLTQLNTILGEDFQNASDFKEYLQKEYNEIVKSVYENKGYYVGRYETSDMDNNGTSSTTVKVVAGTTTGINKVNWYRMYAEQVKYAENKGLTSVGSSMIQGAAYDQEMKFVDTTSYKVKTAENVGHSTTEIGQTTLGVYQTGGLNYPTSGTRSYKDYSKNIYDLEGNVMAWTTEAYPTGCRVYRGGSYNKGFSASYRDVYYPSSNMNWVGSQLQLYVTL